MITTRFAPSPTGDPHIGNIRTTLFTYLFAKKNNGKFLLRIEDTDRERHNEESIEVIKEALNWLKLVPENFDNPMIQSERLELYKKAALKLVEQGDAYVCNCSKERLEQVREKMQKNGQPPMYDKHCCNMNLPYQEGCVIRLKIPENEKISFDDLIRGHVEFDTSTIDDQVILKSDGFPTYHLAHVVDDNEMQITHIIRAEEWLPSTPKHIILIKMLGYNQPEYAHVPVILSPTKGKLSKRDGAVGILEYKKLGYLPEAMINFMALLGWNPKTDEEYFTLEELEKRFDINQVNKAPAVFNIEKLNHYNQHYLRLKFKGETDKSNALKNWGVEELSDGELELLSRGGYNTLQEMAEAVLKIREVSELDPQMLVFKKSTIEDSKKGLDGALKALEQLDGWDSNNIQATLEQIVSENHLSNGDVFWPVRVALSGADKSPSPVELLLALGKDESLKRLNRAMELL